MPILGTAGHVDHGKTSLIRALTGTDTDRLPEEKARGLTIDLGFASLDLPDTGRISIVDVPGHERFLTNMLAGATGIEVALLCIAADESVMAQTREHLAILELLPVEELIVALTRCDLVDEETREMATLEVGELLDDSRFKNSKVVQTSAVSGLGLEDLKSAIDVAFERPDRTENVGWYLPVDRRFTVQGRGSVVTGTLGGGVVREGDEAILQPIGSTVRVRGVESHGEQTKEAHSGSRVALNLSGVDLEDLRRGQIVGKPGTVESTTAIDFRMQWRRRPRYAARVRVALGAEDAIGRAFLNDHDPDLLQLRFEKPVAAVRGQPCIVRLHSPPVLLGGGKVAVPQAKPRRKSEKANVGSDPVALLTNAELGLTLEDAMTSTGLDKAALVESFREIGAVELHTRWVDPERFAAAGESLSAALTAMHSETPERAWVSREDGVRRAGWTWKGKDLELAIANLEETGEVENRGTQLRIPGHKPVLNAKQEAFLRRAEEVIGRSLSTPSVHEMAQEFRIPPMAVEGILEVGVAAERLLRLDGPIWFTASQWQTLVDDIRSRFKDRDFRASEYREEVGFSRKYAIPVLERMDAMGITTRHGDTRRVSSG